MKSAPMMQTLMNICEAPGQLVPALSRFAAASMPTVKSTGVQAAACTLLCGWGLSQR